MGLGYIPWEEIRSGFSQAFHRFIQFVQNPWYRMRTMKIVSPEILTYYILMLSIVPIFINFIVRLGFWGLLSIVVVPVRSLTVVSAWLFVTYLVHLIAFPPSTKKCEVLYVANLATYAATFWILTQTIPFVHMITGLIAFVLFCEAYCEYVQVPKPRVYLAFSCALLLVIIPLLIAFRSH